MSRRELEVLTLLPGPLSAAELFVSANTVRTHIKAIHRKLGVGSRTEAVDLARRHGLLATVPAQGPPAGRRLPPSPAGSVET